ncbi:hypothetical protein GOP47_0013056, partial [Adiantum capillus-veneris]
MQLPDLSLCPATPPLVLLLAIRTLAIHCPPPVLYRPSGLLEPSPHPCSTSSSRPPLLYVPTLSSQLPPNQHLHLLVPSYPRLPQPLSALDHLSSMLPLLALSSP